MILQVMKNSALSAKIHAMSGHILKPEDYDEMLCLETVSAVAAYLNERTGYRKILRKDGVDLSHRGRLEQVLEKEVDEDFEALLHYIKGKEAMFLKSFQLLEYIDEVKLFLRLLYRGTPEQIVEYLDEIVFENDVVKSSELAGMKSFSAFAERIRRTPVYAALSSFEHDEKRQKPFFYDVALDTFYVKILKKMTKRYLSGTERKWVTAFFGVETDLNNLSYILRCKERFQLTEDEIFASMIPYYHKLSEQVIREIVTAPSVKAALQIICDKTPYGNAFSVQDRFFEKRMYEFLARYYHRAALKNAYSLSAAICFIKLRQTEVGNIVSVVEGIRYGLPPEQIRSVLIDYRRKGDEAS